MPSASFVLSFYFRAQRLELDVSVYRREPLWGSLRFKYFGFKVHPTDRQMRYFLMRVYGALRMSSPTA